MEEKKLYFEKLRKESERRTIAFRKKMQESKSILRENKKGFEAENKERKATNLGESKEMAVTPIATPSSHLAPTHKPSQTQTHRPTRSVHGNTKSGEEMKANH